MSNHVLEGANANSDACTSDPSSDGEDSVGGTASDGPTAAEARMENTASSTSPPLPSQPMDPQLLKAATSGDSESLHGMASQHPEVLHGRTPAGNTCLHIASAHGHQEFCKDVLALNMSLLATVSVDIETPLVIAVKSGHASLALVLLAHWRCRQQLTDASAILQKDKNGCNALHHAIRGGHEKLALELIATEAALSRDVNNKEESPMFIAAVKNLTDVIKKLLENSDSPHGGPCSQNALHAAVRKGNPDIARLIMKTRPQLATEENADKSSPMHQAIHDKKIDIVTVLLEHDPSLGYLLCSKSDAPPLNSAAAVGDVDIARELLKHCPDTPYCDKSGFTCLHEAVSNGHTGFVQFVLGSKQLSPLVNMQDHQGRTALHIAAEMRNSKIIPALLLHQGIDITLPNNSGKTARQVLLAATEDNKETIWVCIFFPFRLF
ncbi:hypothetical protein U9M48_018278 [Paspalum notatum var. saurae]|uniref:Uncharacterized protein n=1 Tax=Paspalum notatum var. saurae TaxID=547442 RepID=A0AAQ3TCT4_PASNO